MLDPDAFRPYEFDTSHEDPKRTPGYGSQKTLFGFAYVLRTITKGIVAAAVAGNDMALEERARLHFRRVLSLPHELVPDATDTVFGINLTEEDPRNTYLEKNKDSITNWFGMPSDCLFPRRFLPCPHALRHVFQEHQHLLLDIQQKMEDINPRAVFPGQTGFLVILSDLEGDDIALNHRLGVVTKTDPPVDQEGSDKEKLHVAVFVDVDKKSTGAIIVGFENVSTVPLYIQELYDRYIEVQTQISPTSSPTSSPSSNLRTSKNSVAPADVGVSLPKKITFSVASACVGLSPPKKEKRKTLLFPGKNRISPDSSKSDLQIRAEKLMAQLLEAGQIYAHACSTMQTYDGLDSNTRGCEILHRAVDMNHLSVVKHLHKSGVSLNTGAAFEPLFRALHKRNHEIAEYLISNGALLDLPFNEYHGALSHIHDNDALKVVMLLLSHGADVNAHPVLPFVIQIGRWNVARELLMAKCNPNIKCTVNLVEEGHAGDEHEFTALDSCAKVYHICHECNENDDPDGQKEKAVETAKIVIENGGLATESAKRFWPGLFKLLDLN